MLTNAAMACTGLECWPELMKKRWQLRYFGCQVAMSKLVESGRFGMRSRERSMIVLSEVTTTDLYLDFCVVLGGAIFPSSFFVRVRFFRWI